MSKFYFPVTNLEKSITAFNFWKLNPELSLDEMFQYFLGRVRSSATYNYTIEFHGESINPDPKSKLEDLDISDTDFIFIEGIEEDRTANLVSTNPTLTLLKKCDHCFVETENYISCACNQVINISLYQTTIGFLL